MSYSSHPAVLMIEGLPLLYRPPLMIYRCLSVDCLLSISCNRRVSVLRQ